LLELERGLSFFASNTSVTDPFWTAFAVPTSLERSAAMLPKAEARGYP
jgi:hypothetical protein